LALAQKLFRHEKKTGNILNSSQKTDVLTRLENKTTREAEKIVHEIQPEMKTKASELQFHNIEDDALREKLLRVRGLYAHLDPTMTLSELLHKICDLVLDEKMKVSRLRAGSVAEIRRRVWRRDNGKCRKCGSTHALQIEHLVPRAVGGQSTYENMCLLCRACNQRNAIEYFGLKKMGNYLKSRHKEYVSRRLKISV
jgi:5-methylcytosine-specific restriction endonuclease McrA